ncbi:hypothetical protein N665_0054s0059 [Sinapis alba]|nr:hypothetical protein N665_0054s0059 [Sinapis alba]
MMTTEKHCLVEEEDDDPIQLPDQADEKLIKEYSLSFLGKILNPKPQNVACLIVAMQEQWGISENITACDLGNDRFLFNFDTKEDLNSILSLRPFHHNYCMFVLVRWELVHLQGIPLHLCTEHNLQAICDKLGKVELTDAPEGRIKEREDILIKHHYDRLFKNCSLCGLMINEATYCVKNAPLASPAISNGRETVFDRIICNEHSSYQRSSCSSRDQRSLNVKSSRYNLYSYVRKEPKGGHQRTNSEQTWKEKRIRPPKIGIDSAQFLGLGDGMVIAHTAPHPKPLKPSVPQTSDVNASLGNTVKSQIVDSNVTLRLTLQEKQVNSHIKSDQRMTSADDPTPPYDSPKIGALSDDAITSSSQGNGEGRGKMAQQIVGTRKQKSGSNVQKKCMRLSLGTSTRFATIRDGPWFMISDFNKIRAHHEKEGGKRQYDTSFLSFNQIILDCGMLEFLCTGNQL